MQILMRRLMKKTEQHGANTDIPRLTYRRIISQAPAKLSRRRFMQSGLAVSGVLLTLANRSVLGSDFVCRSPSGFLSGNTSTHGALAPCTGRPPEYWGTHPEQWPSSYETGKCGKKDSSPYSSDSSSSSDSSYNSDSSSSSDPSYNSDSSSSSDSSSHSDSPSSDSPHNLFDIISCNKASDWKDGTRFRDVFDCEGYGSIYYQYSMMQVIWLDENQDPYQLGAHFVAAILNAKIGATPILSDHQLVNIFKEWDRKGFFEPTAGVKWHPEDIVSYLRSTLS